MTEAHSSWSLVLNDESAKILAQMTFSQPQLQGTTWPKLAGHFSPLHHRRDTVHSSIIKKSILEMIKIEGVVDEHDQSKASKKTSSNHDHDWMMSVKDVSFGDPQSTFNSLC
jgi:hypothetical protein